MKTLTEQMADAENRYLGNSKVRKLREENKKRGNWPEVDEPHRIRFRMERLGMTKLITESMADTGDEKGKPTLDVLERIISESELTGVSFLLRGAAVSHSVGRVVIRSPGGAHLGYGTGFMVSPHLMLTNNHVLENSEIARNSVIQFNYQNTSAGEALLPVEFTLQPDVFFETDEYRDFTLVAVSPTSESGRELREFGRNRMIGESGKAVVGERVNIIQHPAGQRKQVALRQNQIVDVPGDFLHYVTDTEPGSSGSPVYNDQWELAALHHAGVPKRDGEGRILLRSGQPWDGSRSTVHLVDWKANEGVRISSIVKYLKGLSLTGSTKQLLDEALNPPEVEMSAIRIPGRSPVPDGGKLDVLSDSVSGFEKDGTASWLFRLNFGPVPVPSKSGAVVSLPSGRPAVPAGDGIDVSDSDEEDIEEEAVSIDPDYSKRKGYRASFLGSGDKRVPLPKLSEAMKANTAVNQQASGADKYVLPYHHYSVVMNGKRRQAYFTAVNIDGKAFRHITREDDRWYFDPRIQRSEQVGNKLYKYNPLDRGHLVRRQDPSWGKTRAIAKTANDDTFHYTNCSPQHKDLNQSNATWAGLEDYILDNARAEDLKVSVFTGPVFRSDDPPYRGVQLPREFWKVAVMVKPNGKLSATAYLLSQANLVQDLEEYFAYGAYKTFQVPVSKIESTTGLDFGKLKDVDPTNTIEGFGEKEITTGEAMML